VTVDDLDSLLSPDGWPYASATPVEPGDPGRFHALFGRDSLICALEVLPARPEVARATLRALAALQGTREDPDTDEEPGKILHEHRPQAPQRLVDLEWPVRDGALLYYGSADSTPWFLVLLAALEDAATTEELEPAWRAAAGWLERALERGGGLVRYGPRERPGGLAQQGWRDAMAPVERHPEGGGILRPDGSAPRAPQADADVQAVAYAALRALELLSGQETWGRRAEALAARIERDFGPGVMALEGDDVAVPGAGSQLGWLLWSGALADGAREAAADRLCEPDVLTPYGLRTLSSSSPVFDPQGYHRGSVWPFDCWLGWSGLRAAGRETDAERVRSGVLAALDRLGRAPELYAVTPAGDLEPAPSANRVQAWSVGARWAFESDWGGRPEWLDRRAA
jgi:glycogen debranching enzyme